MTRLVDTLRALLVQHETGVARTCGLQLVRGDRGGWRFVLTTRTPILVTARGKIIISSATLRPEGLRLMLRDRGRVIVWAPTLPRKDHRAVVADGGYGVGALVHREGADQERERLFEALRGHVAREGARTGLPVGVFGPSEIINLWNEMHLGEEALRAEGLYMPFRGDRAAKFRRLHELTGPHGYMAGYAHGVAGSNDYCVVDDGRRRFIRSIVVIQSVPNLGDIARRLRGIHEGVQAKQYVQESEFITVEEDVTVDWTISPRTVPYAGTEDPDSGTVVVARNVWGYADPLANELLYKSYEGELLQIVGRMRAHIPDPIDPNIECRTLVVGGGAIPDWPVDEVIDLDDLRESLGLARTSTKRACGRPPKGNLTQQLRRRWKKNGPAKTAEWLYTSAVKNGLDARAACMGAILDAGLEWEGIPRQTVIALMQRSGNG